MLYETVSKHCLLEARLVETESTTHAKQLNTLMLHATYDAVPSGMFSLRLTLESIKAITTKGGGISRLVHSQNITSVTLKAETTYFSETVLCSSSSCTTILQCNG